MKAGFWVAPEGEGEAMTVLPIDAEPPTSIRKVNFLATSTAEEMIRRCHQTAKLLPQLCGALKAQKAEEQGQLFDITDFGADDRELLGQVLGDGEVGGIASLANGVIAHIQEAVMAGLWRVRFTTADGALLADYIEVGAIPQAVHEALKLTSTDFGIGAPPAGAMNVMPVLVEIKQRMAQYRAGDPAHVITFSLFPMSPADMDFMQAALGAGPVQLISRGYGTCRVVATGARNVWSVQFYNAMDTIILDTLEIGGVPVVACAADDDFKDSADRLHEVNEAYFL